MSDAITLAFSLHQRCALLSACTVGPELRAAGGGHAGRVQGNAKAGKRRSRATQELRGNWWEVFDDPLLNALMEQVDVSNQNLAQADARNSARRARWCDRRASGYFPTVSAAYR